MSKADLSGLEIKGKSLKSALSNSSLCSRCLLLEYTINRYRYVNNMKSKQYYDVFHIFFFCDFILSGNNNWFQSCKYLFCVSCLSQVLLSDDCMKFGQFPFEMLLYPSHSKWLPAEWCINYREIFFAHCAIEPYLDVGSPRYQSDLNLIYQVNT
jgi:hypothetical protein